MNRKEFVKTALLGATALAAVSGAPLLAASAAHPRQTRVIKDFILHRANTRGVANLGWLKSHHTFSFSHYHNPERMNFGVLRVLNDDTVAPGMGFGRHPHADMEIISIPLDGDLEHQDSMGNKTVIRRGDVQVMSAGTGVEHSEYNANSDREVKFLQIWVFPEKRGVAPRYDQISVGTEETRNRFAQVLSPNPDDAGVWIHQQAWFDLGKFDQATTIEHALRKADNGLYVFMISGNAIVDGQDLGPRDGLGIPDAGKVSIEASTGSEILLMEVPMKLV